MYEKSSEIKTEKGRKTMLAFYEWLGTQIERNDPVGDLARDTMQDPESSARPNNYDSWKQRLITTAAWEAFRQAWKEYDGYYEEEE